MSFWNWEWVGTHLDLIGEKLVEHLWLTFLAVAIGLLISFPLAIYAHRHPRTYPPIAWISGLLYTIPSLALFALLVPFTGLSTLTAEIGLIGYTLLILIRNAVTGLGGTPDDVKEAARGMGYTERGILWRVEVPMAAPVIIAGVRIAAVTTIGLVTVTALIGKGGLGALMLGGFRNLYPDIAVLVGVVLSVLVAVAADGMLLGLQRLVAPWAGTARVRTAT
ncbi:MAG: ABC transporter permease [Actinomycetota bacterium]